MCVIYRGVCIYMYMFIYGGHASHRFDFLSALVLPYKYCLPTNFLFVVQAEQNDASCRENIFESQSPSCTVLSGEKREKSVTQKNKECCGKTKSTGFNKF